MNTAQIDLQQLRIKHILYKSKVRSVLYGGTFDAQFFSASGPVETWFNTVGQPRYRQHAQLQELHGKHRMLSNLALRLIALHNQGRIDQAHHDCGQLEQLSAAVLDGLASYDNQMKGEGQAG